MFRLGRVAETGLYGLRHVYNANLFGSFCVEIIKESIMYLSARGACACTGVRMADNRFVHAIDYCPVRRIIIQPYVLQCNLHREVCLKLKCIFKRKTPDS